MISRSSSSRPGTGRQRRQSCKSGFDGYVHDEVLYREGMAAGLGQDDVVIKRRVRQKIEVMAEEEGERAAPTDAELDAYLAAQPARSSCSQRS